jgi:Tol biopolymer transport system component
LFIIQINYKVYGVRNFVLNADGGMLTIINEDQDNLSLAAVSNDGNYIAFKRCIREIPGAYTIDNLLIKMFDTEELREITNFNDCEISSVTISSNNIIAFIRFVRQGDDWIEQILAYSMDEDRLDTLLTTPSDSYCPGYIRYLSCSPSGDEIAFSLSENSIVFDHQIYVMKSNGSGRKQLPSIFDFYCIQGFYGRYVYFNTFIETNNNIFRIDKNSSVTENLTKYSTNCKRLQWTFSY